MEEIITLGPENIADEHICCAISDKKCAESYQAKKDWLKQEFANGYVFQRLNERAKVFIEYGPAENGWAPVEAPGYLLINCFWVSGKYKGQGYGKTLLQKSFDAAIAGGKYGLTTVVGTKKFHFMSDTKWLIRQGFQECDRTDYGFSLLVKKLNTANPNPCFKESVRSGTCSEKEGLTAYYSNRCPFSEYHVHVSLKEAAEKRNLKLNMIKLDTLEKARSAPTPATIFSLFKDGRFVTTDVSACMGSRFDKIVS